MSGTNVNIGQISVIVNDTIPPDNYATVDVGTKVGTVYTKEQNNAWRKEVEQNTNAGIKGVAKPDDTIVTTGFYRMLVEEADTYTNYLDILNNPIEVLYSEFDIVNGVQRNEVIIEVNNGVSTKKVYAKVGADGANGTATIPKWVAGNYSPDAMVIHDFVQFITPNGATVNDIPGESNKWIAIGKEEVIDFILENKKYLGSQWVDFPMVQGSYISGDTVSAAATYNYLKIDNLIGVEKIRISGTSRHSAESVITCYAKKTDGSFVTIYNTPGIELVNYEISIDSQYTAIYVNLRPLTPTKVEAYKTIEAKIYAEPQDVTEVKDWVLENSEEVREETTPQMFNYTLLNNGTYTDLGTNYKHTDYYEFKAGDVLEIEYVTNATLHYLFTFNTSKVFIEGLWAESNATGGRKKRTFEPDFDGFLIVNSNFQSTLGLPKITKVYQQERFLTPQSGGGGGVAPKAHFYDVDSHYLPTDNGDYGITLNRIFGLMTDRGGIIDFGVKDYKISTPVIVTKSAVFRGIGGMEFYSRKWMTGIYTDSPTMDMISVVGGVYFFAGNIHFYNRATLPTAGSGLRLKGSTPASGSTSDKILALVSGSIIQNCSFDGFYDNMMFDNACQWTLINPLSNYAVRYGLYIDAEHWRDAGDSTILGGNFFGTKEWLGANNRNSKAHIYHKGSGGLKINSVKFNNKADYSILGEIAGDTVILNVSNCSFENHNISAIKYSKTSNVFRHINISNCEFDSYKNNTVDIDINSGIEDINIIGNSFSSGMANSANTAIKLNSVSRVNLKNTYNGYANPLDILNSSEVDNGLERFVTQAQYDALSTAQKNNGTKYFISG